MLPSFAEVGHPSSTHGAYIRPEPLGTSRCSATSTSALRLLHQVLDVLFVLQHDLIQQISIELDCLNHFDRPWFGVGFQIFDSELDFQAAEVYPVKFFGHHRAFTQWAAAGIEPHAVAESVGLYNQNIAFPFATRVAVPCRIGVARKRAAICEDLPESGVQFVKNH